jgi:hypothetical protein
MSAEIGITLKATDEASGVIADAGRNISESMQGVERLAEVLLSCSRMRLLI